MNILRKDLLLFKDEIEKFKLEQHDQERYYAYKHVQSLRKLDYFFLAGKICGVIAAVFHMTLFLMY